MVGHSLRLSLAKSNFTKGEGNLHSGSDIYALSIQLVVMVVEGSLNGPVVQMRPEPDAKDRRMGASGRTECFSCPLLGSIRIATKR